MKTRLDPLVDILAFYAANRNYGYLDRLANALDEVTAYEAVRDALRDYYSQCIDRGEKSEDDIACPRVEAGELEEAVEEFVKRIRNQPGDVIVRETRELVLESLARKPKFMEMKRGGQAEGKEGAQGGERK